MNDVAHLFRETIGSDANMDDVGEALRSIQDSIHTNAHLKSQLEAAEVERIRLHEETLSLRSAIRTEKAKNAEYTTKISEQGTNLADQERIIAEKGLTVARHERAIAEHGTEHERIVAEHKRNAAAQQRQIAELERKLIEQHGEHERKMVEQMAVQDRNFMEQLALQERKLMEEFNEKERKVAERERTFVEQFSERERKLVEEYRKEFNEKELRYSERERKVEEELKRAAAAQERKREEQFAADERKLVDEFKKELNELEEKAAERDQRAEDDQRKMVTEYEGKIADHEARYAELLRRNQQLIAEHEGKFADAHLRNQSVVGELDARYADLQRRNQFLIVEYDTKIAEAKHRADAANADHQARYADLQEEMQVAADTFSKSLADKSQEYQALCAKTRNYENRIRKNALARSSLSRSEHFLRASFARWRAGYMRVVTRYRFERWIDRSSGVRALILWRGVARTTRSVRRHLQSIATRIASRTMLAWKCAVSSARQACREDRANVAVGSRNLQRVTFLHWVGCTNARWRNTCEASFALCTRKKRVREILTVWKHRTHKSRCSNGAIAMHVRARWARFMCGIRIRRRLAERYTSMAETVFRFPFAGHWRLVKIIFRAWERAFRPEHTLAHYFNGWRTIFALTKVASAQVSFMKMDAYVQRCDDKIGHYAAKMQEALKHRDDAVRKLDSTCSMLKEQVDDTHRWSNTCAELQKKTMELENGKQKLEEVVKQLEHSIAVIKVEEAKKDRRCAACSRESARFLKGCKTYRRPLASSR